MILKRNHSQILLQTNKLTQKAYTLKLTIPKPNTSLTLT